MMVFLDNLRPIFDEKTKVAFTLFGHDVAWYAIIILTGALISALYGYYRFVKRLGLGSDNVFYGVVLGLFFGILGARIYYVFFTATSGEIKYDGIFDMINPMGGGLAIHGGIIATVIFLIVYSKKIHMKLLPIVEIVMPFVMFSQAVGRWGNFVNQEAFGSLIPIKGIDMNSITKSTILTDEMLLSQREVLSKLLIPDFIIDRMYISYSSAAGFICPGYYYPTFLFESVFNLIGFIIYMILRKYCKKIVVGDSISFYLVWYGMVRYFIESLRTDPLMLGSTGIKVAQLTSIIYIVLGIIIFIFRRVFKYKLVSVKDGIYDNNATIMEDGYHHVEPYFWTVIINKLKNIHQKVIIFDCDGTVLDTFDLIEKSVYQTFSNKLPNYQLTKEEAHAFFGHVIYDSFRKYTSDENEVEELVNYYRQCNAELMADYIKTFDGMEELLKELKLKGFKIAIVSNKVSDAVAKGLKLCKLNQYFDIIIGAELLDKPKPDPSGIQKALKMLKRKDAIMIGDTIIDIETGKNASIQTIGVTWCKTTRETFKQHNATYIVDRPSEILDIVKE